MITLEIRLEDREALTSKIDLIPEINLAFVLLAPVTVTIILIRHGNKNHSGTLKAPYPSREALYYEQKKET